MASHSHIPEHKHSHLDHSIRIPTTHPHCHHHRSNSTPPSSPPSPPLEGQNISLDMAQRSAVARSKLEKIASPSGTTRSSQRMSRISSSSFSNIFSTLNIGTTAANNRQTYLPDSKKAFSSSSLPLPQLSTDKPKVPLILISQPDDPEEHEPKVISDPTSEALQKLQNEYEIVLAQNAELRAALAAEKETTAKLLCFLQEYHESQGRINPEKGNLNSIYYRNLKDGQGNNLVPREIADLEPALLSGGLRGGGLRGKMGNEKVRMKRNADDQMKEIKSRNKKEGLDMRKKWNKEEDWTDGRALDLQDARSFDS